MTAISDLTFSPLLPETIIIGGVLCAGALILFTPVSKPARAMRQIALGALSIWVLQPQLTHELRTPVPYTVAVITDNSPSNTLGKRQMQTQQALNHVRQEIEKRPDLYKPVYLSVTGRQSGETRVLEQIQTTFAHIPKEQRGGAIIIGDGIFHDLAPENGEKPRISPDTPPTSLFLTGEKKEFDHRLSLINRPGYGIVGQSVSVRARIESNGNTGPIPTKISVINQGKVISTLEIENTGQDIDIPLNIAHAGENVFLLRLEHMEGEVTTRNNDMPVIVQGVRDRLNVLLVSAEPYIGGRMWRNLLTSDPAIDLVHFTILRTPQSLDPTPSHEMALIPFPFDDLFDNRLYDFDLIILDRYRADNIMPDRYLDNIARFVEQGGALLDVAGTDYAGPQSISITDLGNVLPAQPDGNLIEKTFSPELTASGKIHPVTAALTDVSGKWPSWSMQVATTAQENAITLMTGADDLPLLLLRRVDQGRVAQLTSDQIWLWSRGVGGDGPYYPLLRPLIHWLLSDPSLEEERFELKSTPEGHQIFRHTLVSQEPEISISTPDGKTVTVPMAWDQPGVAKTTLPDAGDGVYHLKSGDLERDIYIGSGDQPEWQHVISDDRWMIPFSTQTGGRIIRLEQNPEPALPLPTQPAYQVSGSTQKPALPDYVWLIMLLGIFTAAWMVEGRSKK